MYEPASLGMFQCRLQRILCDFEVIMFFRKDPPQTEGRRHADLLIKTEPAVCRLSASLDREDTVDSTLQGLPTAP